MKKISFAKIGLLIKNNYIINRSIPLILFIVALVLGCIIGAMPISDIENRYQYGIAMNYDRYESYKYSMEQTYEDLIGMDSVFSLVYIVTALILAFLAVLSLNGFMRDKSGNDFYHSLAVNRGEIFLANYLTAFANSAVTILASQLGGLLLMNFIADYKPMTLGEMLLEQLPVIATVLLFLALFIALAMIATIGAGTVFAGIVNYLCLNFYVPATVLAVAVSGTQLFSTDLMDYLQHFPWIYSYSSPFIRYIYSSAGYLEITAVSYILMAVATVALIGLGIWLYTVKKNENGSKTLPFTVMVRPMQYLLLFDAIILGATFFEAITGTFIWCLIGGLLALFFGFIVFNAFADKSFNGVFKHSRHMVFILIATLILGAVFVADVFHIYKKPVPDYDQIESSYMHVSMQYNDREEWVSYEFVDELNQFNEQYAVEVNDSIAQKLGELYRLVSEDDSSRAVESKNYMSISMSIRCKDDAASYHAYAYVADSSKNWSKIKALVEALAKEAPKQDKQVYYYENTEAVEIVD